MRIIITTKARQQKMLKEAYELGLNIRDKIDSQTRRMEERRRGTIMSGYDMDKELEEILKRKGCK